ncbi:MAG: hypothetical protein ACK5RL_14660, partial [Acidimicrobiales bacterium]
RCGRRRDGDDMKVTDVQVVSVVANTLTARTPRQPAPRTADEAETQVAAFVALVTDLLDRPTVAPHDKLDRRPTTLKVILAPEFYFRCPEGQPDGRGHFTQQDFIQIMGTVRAELRQLFDRFRPQPWLVMPGTVVWGQEQGNNGVALVNTIFGVDFTDPAVPAKDILCDKQYFSAIDGLDRWRNAAQNNQARPASLGYRSAQTIALAATTQAGQPIGVGAEICLDHAYGVLRSAVTDRDRPADVDPPPELHLHVILACGMDLNPLHAAVSPRVTGVVLRCNGNRYNADRAKVIRSDVYRRMRIPTGGFVWRRDPEVQGRGRIRAVDMGLQRPSRPDGTFDAIGVSPSYPIG